MGRRFVERRADKHANGADAPLKLTAHGSFADVRQLLATMRFEFRIQAPGPRPPYVRVAEYLWGAGVDFDSDGDSRTPDDRNWTELTVIRRGDSERVDVDPVSESPLELRVVSESRDLALRVANFLARTTGGALTPDP